MHSVELLAGLLSWASDVPVIYFLHTGLSGFGGGLLVLGAARLLR